MINILHLEDDLVDVKLVRAKLAQAGLSCRIALAQTLDELENALAKGSPNSAVNLFASSRRMLTILCK